MITEKILDRFLQEATGQPARQGVRYASEHRVGGIGGSAESVTTLVSGRTGEYEVALWVEKGRLAHRCSCPSWRDPCKHEVAAAIELKERLTGASKRADGEPAGSKRWRPEGMMSGEASLVADLRVIDPDEARAKALEGRRTAGRKEPLEIRPAEPPFLEVRSASGFAYRVHLRGDALGPHSCDCPDFEANRLHTCKHVEKARLFLKSGRGRIPAAHKKEAARPRVYLHFGEVVEPRLFGKPKGPGSRRVQAEFDETGLPFRPLSRSEDELATWLGTFGDWVEPQGREWLGRRVERRPVLPSVDIRSLLPRLAMKPYPYQWIGASFLATRGRALLADEMGLGKTVQAILAAVALRRAASPVLSTTIVCPASLRGGWQKEIGRWIGEEVTLLEGNARERERIVQSRPRWLVTHFEQVWRDYPAHAAARPDLLIIDEAQRAKGLAGKTARVLKTIDTRYVFALTGTPLENRLEEAYAIAQLIDQRLLPPLWQVDRDHFVRDEKGRRVVLYRNLDAMRSRLAPAFLRRMKEDVELELPERIRSMVMVPMHAAVVSTYDDVMLQVARIASRKVLLPADLERIQRLLVIARRACNGPHMLGIEAPDRQVPKLEELEEALRELCLGDGRKAVVFSEWTDMTNRVESMAQRIGLPVFHLHGGVAIKSRQKLIDDFGSTKGPAVFVSTDAGGVGLNLQAADVVISLDLPWNPARLEQRIARVHRIGSKGTVNVLLIVTKDSVEERILSLHETKKNVLANVWASGGDDTIAAPGGSGAFKEMVKSLLSKRDDLAPATAKIGEDRRNAADDPERHGELLPAARDRVQDEPVSNGEPDRAERGDGRDQPGAPMSEHTGAGSSVPVDPAHLAAAIAAIAPTLPPDHRRSLASVFRALAEALEG